MICKSQIRLKRICPVRKRGAKMTKEANTTHDTALDIYPLYNPVSKYQVYGSLDFTVKSLITENCYNS